MGLKFQFGGVQLELLRKLVQTSQVMPFTLKMMFCFQDAKLQSVVEMIKAGWAHSQNLRVFAGTCKHTSRDGAVHGAVQTHKTDAKVTSRRIQLRVPSLKLQCHTIDYDLCLVEYAPANCYSTYSIASVVFVFSQRTLGTSHTQHLTHIRTCTFPRTLHSIVLCYIAFLNTNRIAHRMPVHSLDVRNPTPLHTADRERQTRPE
uniref:Uncharacterized protein n=1 Tax=Craspedostauros australis TaxID=1486917 RepID=A0A7R9ZRJ3_9STRA|mmetsp:Transcript_7103/g.19272  ORF Transcript_7103/g.19272 Transcript_7103/m.19272 type:complete len:203 (+) Transcript_7103:427-1035(+)